MLETRLPPVSTPPPPAARPSARPGAAARVRCAPPPPAERLAPPDRTAGRAAAARSGRLARSEARLLGVAVVGAALLCAVLVLYLAAYAHVSQLGVDAAAARRQLRQERLENDHLQATLARLQSPARVAAAAQALGMTQGARRATYLAAPGLAAPDIAATAADSPAIPQVADSGTAADTTGGH